MVKSRFAGMLRSLLRRMDPPAQPPVEHPAERPMAAAAPIVSGNPVSTAAPMPPPVSRASVPPNANEIAVPLAPIVTSLPMDLRGRLMAVPPPGMTINLPVETVMSQLAFGAVKISFGELRQLAPGIFANSGGEHDAKTISLPLGEILPRLNPVLLARRATAKVEVAADISGPFGGGVNSVVFTTQPLKAPAPVPAPTPPSQSVPPPAAPHSFAPAPGLQRPAAPASAPTPTFARVSPPVAPSAPITFTPPPSFQRAVPAAPPTPSVRPVAPAPAPPTPKISAAPAPAPTRAPAFAPTPVAPQPAVKLPTISATLWDLAENWPEEMKNEISRYSLANINVPLAGDVVEAGLKRGRVTMTWRELRVLARPNSTASPNDPLELDLPLKVIAPMFLAAQKNFRRSKTKTTVSSDIPNLFFGFPQPAPAPVAVPVTVPATAAKPVESRPVEANKPVEKKSSDSNFFVWGDEGEVPKLEDQYAPPPVPQTDFTSRYASPKEVVARAAALSGVVGAVITLPDGLRVASAVPAEFNADTLAAFIPQLFERMNQSAKELRMGALNNVSFTVGNVPWRIIRVNAVYLAAFGRAGESLPAAQLTALAAELDRKKTQ